jgi:hypothetical protein
VVRRLAPVLEAPRYTGGIMSRTQYFRLDELLDVTIRVAHQDALYTTEMIA